jgi:hypothetical protein
MTPTQFFIGGYHFTGSWDDYLIFVIMLVACVLGLLLFRERSRHEPMVHSPPMAWLRASLYFCFVLTFSWVTGVFKTIVSMPLATPEQLCNPLWIGFLVLCLLVIVWAYAYWWPRGSLTHGRKLYLVPTILYGLVWGTCAGLLLLSIYSIIEIFQLPRLVNAILFVVLVSIYNMNYQLGWWDIHVSPPHNIRATNNSKVLFAHQPFMVASLTFLLVYGNVGIYVIMNALALCLSAIALRFPPFWAEDGGPVSMDTAIGE